MPSSVVTLGGFRFQGHEVPEDIPFGGQQRLVKHVLIGGRRVTDAMGWAPEDPVWRGRFRGSQAVSRAKSVERIANRGGQVPLSWGGIRLTVVIEKFRADYRRSIDIPYAIECYVVEAGAGASGGAATPLGTLIGGDLGGAVGLMGGLFSDGPAGALGALGTALDAVGAIASAPIGALAPVQTLAAGAIGALDTAIGVADVAFSAAQVLDASLPTGPAFAASLLAQSGALDAQDALLRARGLVGRVAVNLASAGI